ncbi:MAG: DNA polymerase subunit beta [Methanospirillaceae archaeon]|nr:DNA polymerase subunit beta [Methanospirillaceae archaeon]
MKRYPRLRDFIRDTDGWLYAVCTYDNQKKAGCILRYVPDTNGERTDPYGERYRKIEFSEAYDRIRREKPEYSDLVQRVPLEDITEVLKPDERMRSLAAGDPRISRLLSLLQLPSGGFGVTGSILCGLAGPESDIDGVVYGDLFLKAQKKLQTCVQDGSLASLDDELWKKIYRKRSPELSYDEFILHEKRKWNRGKIDGTYFDLLFTRDYTDIRDCSFQKGEVCGTEVITAEVTDAVFGFDSPARYDIAHPDISCILSFTHTYTGQVRCGEMAEAKGVVERHGDEYYLVVGTTREARGEYIRSLSLLAESEEL